MVQFNFAKGEVQCKLVYYGPGCSGKTANLRAIHARAPAPVRGALTTIATDTDRTLFFDFLPLNLGDVAGIQAKVHLYAIPYQKTQNSLRVLVLQGVDGLVFVADSSASHATNQEALTNLRENLRAIGREIDDIPLVFQWNKSDLPDVHPAGELERTLNPEGRPSFAAVATTGDGVFATLKALTQEVLVQVSQMVAARPTAAPAFVSAPEPQPVPEPEPEPVAVEPAPVRVPAETFDDVDLPPEFPDDEPSTSHTPPWRLKVPPPPSVVPAAVPVTPEPEEEKEEEQEEEEEFKLFSTTTSIAEGAITDPPRPEPEAEYAGLTEPAADDAYAERDAGGWDDVPATAEPPVLPRRPARSPAPYGGGWSGIDAHGRRRPTQRTRDARPVVDRRREPRRKEPPREEIEHELPLTNLVAGSLIALVCLVTVGLLVHKLL
ncbi:MAG: GTP-binding protein [Planctomycetota bacterium]|jgi:signal recognition particle receptor subunit beta